MCLKRFNKHNNTFVVVVVSFFCLVSAAWWVILYNNNFTFFRTIESLYEELVHEGILVRAPKTRLKEYAGEYRYVLNIVMLLQGHQN